MALLEIRNLCKAFKNVTAVNCLSLSIGAGEVHGILGPNGAGKSTMINCMLGFIPFDSGSVIFEGNAAIGKWSKNIGYVPQELAIYPELTAAENISFFCSLYGFKGAGLRQRTEYALEFVGLEEVRDKKAGEFSGGMKRRLNLACGIVHSPKLIIMDEPTVGIDPQSRNRILENVHTLNEKGATILYTTHYMPEVEAICNKITVIDHGSVVAGGTKSEIMNLMGRDAELLIEFGEDEGDLQAFAAQALLLEDVHQLVTENRICRIRHSDDVILIDRILPIAIENRLAIKNISKREPDLEELFLSLTGKELRDRSQGVEL